MKQTPEQRKQYKLAYENKHSKEELLAKHREYAAKWRTKNPDKVKASAKKAYLKDPVKYKRYNSAWLKRKRKSDPTYVTCKYKPEMCEKHKAYLDANPIQRIKNNIRERFKRFTSYEQERKYEYKLAIQECINSMNEQQLKMAVRSVGYKLSKLNPRLREKCNGLSFPGEVHNPHNAEFDYATLIEAIKYVSGVDRSSDLINIHLHTKNGYARLHTHGYGTDMLMHRLLGIYKYKSDLSGMVIHHINENKLDNRLTNLQAMTSAEHSKLPHKKRIDYQKNRLFLSKRKKAL